MAPILVGSPSTGNRESTPTPDAPAMSPNTAARRAGSIADDSIVANREVVEAVQPDSASILAHVAGNGIAGDRA